MKQLITILLVWTTTSLFAQPCLPEGIHFNTQEQISSFQINYPDCTEIEGFVWIHGSDIISLNGLNVLTSIGDSLVIQHTDSLTSLMGLDNLTSIGGDLLIKGNNGFASLMGLESLTSIGRDCKLYVGTALTSLTGLENLSTIGDDFIIGSFGAGNSSLTNFAGLEALTSIGGFLSISGHENLSSFAGLEGLTYIGAHLSIGNNANLSSIASLEGLTSIDGTIIIENNTNLTSLTGLGSIQANSITGLYINTNSILAECAINSVCQYLASPGATMEIYDNAPGCNSVVEVEEACEELYSCLPEGIIFTTQEQVDSFQVNYPGCTMIQGSVYITGTDITNLNGLNVLTSVGWELSFNETSRLKNLIGLDSLSYPVPIMTITNNDSLTSLVGLGPITSVNDLIIDNNPELQSLNGLNSLINVLYTLVIQSNNSLTDLTGLDDLYYIGHYGSGFIISSNQNLQNLSGLGSLASINNGFWIENNSSLENLIGLESLTSINQDFNIINNSNLANLTGINSLTTVGWSFEIKNNIRLNNLSGLNSLISIGTLLNIQNNDSLVDVIALSNLHSLIGLQIADNDILQNLLGIESVNPNDINSVYITDNDSLSECDAASVCAYLISGGWAIINSNNDGCNSKEEVEDACLTEVEELDIHNDQFNVYPNPTDEFLYIIHSDLNITFSLELRNLYGQVVKEEKNIQSLHYTLSIADLTAGVYFYLIRQHNDIIQQGKLIIK